MLNINTIITQFITQAPWAIVILIVLYFIYRELKSNDSQIQIEMKQQDERLQKEMKQQYELLQKEMKQQYELLQKEMKQQYELLQKEMKQHYELLQKEIKGVDERIQKEMKQQYELLQKEMKQLDERLQKEMKGVKSTVTRLGKSLLGIQEITWGMLSQKGILSSEETSTLYKTLSHFIDISLIPTNPLTDDEKKRIIELVKNRKPEDLTHQEAEELYNLSLRAIDEIGEQIWVYYLFHYAVIMRNRTLKD